MISALLESDGPFQFSKKYRSFNIEETPDKFQNEEIWNSH